MKKLILHIPHASTHIPDDTGYLADDATLKQELKKLTDWYTDDLFSTKNDITIKAGFSRLFCDVERFADDSQEIMAQYGMGVLYEKCDDGTPLRTINAALREKIVGEYYTKHHARFTEAVEHQLRRCTKALIIDCHSFPDTPLLRDLNHDKPRPDFNLGIDPFHTPSELVDKAVRFFETAGYSVEVDRPHSSSIVPLPYYRKNKKVQSLMPEINRKLYLNASGNRKSENYPQIKPVFSIS